MKVFGATAYVHVPQPLRQKLDSHSKKGIFVGYEIGFKAYRVLLDIGKMSITRDVIFDEAIKQGHAANSVPYHDSESESDADDPAAAVKEEADTAAEVVAKEAVEEEGQETTAAAPEHRFIQFIKETRIFHMHQALVVPCIVTYVRPVSQSGDPRSAFQSYACF